MSDRIKKLEGKIAKRKQRIEKLNDNLKDEKSRLATDEALLFNLKYSEVLKRLQETGVSPDEALRAIDNEVKGQKENNPNDSNNSEGVRGYAQSF